MARNFLTGLRLVNLPTDPLSGSEGELYFNTTNDVIKIYYNGSWHTLTGINEGPADASRITAYVKNGPVALAKGVPVYATGSDGTNIIIGPSSNIAESTSSKTIGFTQTALNANQHGYIVLEGILDGLNTIAGQDGDPIWLGSASGTVVYGLANKPQAPNHLVYLGILSRSNANNGEIFVKIQNGFELKELHDVRINGVQNKDIITWNSSSSIWINEPIQGYLNSASVSAFNAASANAL